MSRQLDPPSKGDPGSLRLTSEMPAPTTAAGRAAMRGIIGGSLALWRDEPDAIADLILAIEAEARAAPDPAPLDVERLARALQRVIDNGDALALFREDAAAIAREYAKEPQP